MSKTQVITDKVSFNSNYSHHEHVSGPELAWKIDGSVSAISLNGNYYLHVSAPVSTCVKDLSDPLNAIGKVPLVPLLITHTYWLLDADGKALYQKSYTRQEVKPASDDVYIDFSISRGFKAVDDSLLTDVTVKVTIDRVEIDGCGAALEIVNPEIDLDISARKVNICVPCGLGK